MSRAVDEYFDAEFRNSGIAPKTWGEKRMNEDLKEEMLSAGLPKFQKLKDMVSNANNFVVDLEKCSDVFRSVIDGIKDQLGKANLLVCSLEKAQQETVLNILDIDWSDVAIQVNPYSSAPYLEKSSKSTQTESMEEVLLHLVLTSKQLPATKDLFLSEKINRKSKKQQFHEAPIYTGSSWQRSTIKQIRDSITGSDVFVDARETFPQVKGNLGANKTLPKLSKKTDHVESQTKVKRKKKFLNMLRVTVLMMLTINVLLLLSLYRVLGMIDQVDELENEVQTALDTYVPQCTSLPALSNGNIQCRVITESFFSRFTRRTRVCKFRCNVGYRLSSRDSTIQCLFVRRWNATFPTCVRPICTEADNRDCATLHRMRGIRTSGFYQISPCGVDDSFFVYCNFGFAGGGWTAIQRRLDNRTSFARPFREFEHRFGEPMGSYWIGLQIIHHLTAIEPQSLLILLTDWYYPSYHRARAYAWYRNFSVENSSTLYRLHVANYNFLVLGLERAGDSMYDLDGMQFTAMDADHDQTAPGNCARIMGAAWWHRSCTSANLNAEYTDKNIDGRKSIHWRTWRGSSSLRSAEMYIRPQGWR